MRNTVNEIINSVKTDVNEFVNYCEDNYHSQIDNIVNEIAKKEGRSIVMISGPSGSGKTTSAKLLLEKLKEISVSAFAVSLDDFYLNAEDQPVLADGTRDTESVHSLDIELIEKCCVELINNGKSNLPIFDFATKRRSENTQTIVLPSHAVLIIEGLHGLNPLITEHIPKENILKVYISLNEPILDENGDIYLSSRHLRLSRRIIRDMKFRSSSPETTLSMWTNVVKEEEKTLLRYKPLADMRIVTLHPYEICIYKPYLKNMLATLDKNTENFEFFKELALKAQIFEELNEDVIPEDSLINEFV